MDSKPVAILGGGFWGSLLAYAIKKNQPDFAFKLYVEETSFGDGLSLHFRSDEVGKHLNWIKPLVDLSWNEHVVKTCGRKKILKSGFHFISRESWNDLLQKELSDQIVRVSSLDLDSIREESRYVIDTRANVYFQAFGFHKTMEIELEVETHTHYLPTSLDLASLDKGYGFFQFIPVSAGRIIVREQRFSQEASLVGVDFEQNLMNYLVERGIRVKSLLRKNSHIHRIPTPGHVPWNEGRLIRLNHISHPVTGNRFGEAVRVIDDLSSSSLRPGEVKAILARHREHQELHAPLFHKLCRELSQTSGKIVLHYLHRTSPRCRRKFYRGNLKARDLSLSLVDFSWMKESLGRLLPLRSPLEPKPFPGT